MLTRSEARHQRLLEILAPGREVRVQELCKKLDASPATIRRDLETLERDGRIIRTYGGAVLREINVFRPSYRERLYHNQALKASLARRAVAEVGHRETIIICGGTTTYHMAEELVNSERELTVVTNALDIAMQLARSSHIRTVIIGGEISDNYSIGGFLGETMLAGVARVDRAFLGADGIDLTHGLTAYLPEDAAIIRKMVHIALQVVALVDHTKFGQVKLAPLIDLGDIDLVITDDHIPPDVHDAYKAAGVPLELASVDDARLRQA